MKSLEVFSGAGGLALGMKLAGFEHSALVEWNKDACNTLSQNFLKTEIYNSDIREFDFFKYSDVNVISGGPPCQPFSLGGKHKGNLDERDMFPQAIRGIRVIQPQAFIFENVKGILRESFSEYFNYIILQLTYPFIEKDKNENWRQHSKRLSDINKSNNYESERYDVQYKLVNSADYGVPQKRERVIIVGIKRSLGVKWDFPNSTHSQDALIWDKYVSKEYWDRLYVSKDEREEKTPQLQKVIDRIRNRYGMFKPSLSPWITVREALIDLPDPIKYKCYSRDHIYKDGAKIYPGHTGSFIDEPSKTIKAGAHGVPGGENMIRLHNGSVRYFTVLEAKRIQTFPDEYNITGVWSEAMRQLGNAVPVHLGYVISQSLMDKIRQPIKTLTSVLLSSHGA